MIVAVKYVNLAISSLSEPEFSEASLKQIGIWLRIYAYCATLENHGLIMTAGAWSDSHCKRILGCSRKELDKSPLWHINASGALNLFHYNLIAEGFSKARRKTARLAGQHRSPSKTAAARANGEKGGRPAKTIQFPATQTL